MISNTQTGKYGDEPCIKGLDLNEITFELSGNREIVDTSGKCVWESISFDNVSAGIRFEEMSNENKNRISKLYQQIL